MPKKAAAVALRFRPKMRLFFLYFLLSMPAQAGSLKLGIVAEETPAKTKAAAVLANYIAQQTKHTLEIVWAQNQQELLDQAVDLAWLGPFAALDAKQNRSANLLLKASLNGRSSFYSAFIVRADSGIERLTGLAKKDIAWTDRYSASGYVLPKAAVMKVKKMDANLFFGKEIFLNTPKEIVAALDKKIVAAGVFKSDNAAGTSGEWNRVGSKTKFRAVFVTDAAPGNTLVSLNQNNLAEAAGHAFAKFSNRSVLKELFAVDALVELKEKDFDTIKFAKSALGAL